MTFSPAGTRSASAALVRPIRGRRSNTFTSPRRSPSTSTVPSVGCTSVAATWSSVVLPAPFGPITIQRSSSCAVQSTFRNSSDVSRRTVTPRSLSTSSDTACPSSTPTPFPPGRTAAETEPMPPRAVRLITCRNRARGLVTVPPAGGRPPATPRAKPMRAERYGWHAMNQSRTTLLITLTARDRPGVTARLFGALARFPLSVADIEQVTIRGRLVLGVLVSCTEPPDLTAIYGVVSDLAADFGLEAEITTGTADVPARAGSARVRGRLHVTVLGRPLPPSAVAAVAGGIAADGANIDRITRLASDPGTCVELDGSGGDPGARRNTLAQ